VSQVLENLLVNAAHAFEGRPGCGRIQVRAERVDQHVRITVSDNGPGVPDEVRPRLFEPFVTTKVIGKGSGLGLTVSKGLMRSQNGDLVLVRTSAAGTEMAVTLPWTALDPPAPAREAASPEMPADMTVLIIDDEPDVREMLLDACSVLFTASAAGSITDGLAQIEDGLRPDVVLCDLMMPDGGAYEWLQQCELRRSPLAGRTIIITGGPATPQDEALLAAHADRVLLKPFSLTQLKAMVTRTMEAATTAPPATS
jgi:CheY-like chemotaxis protein